MQQGRYSARIGDSNCIAQDVVYEALVQRIMEFTIRAALARSVDESEWEHEELRRRGLAAIQLFRNGKAVWDEPIAFKTELAEAQREGISERFLAGNELDPALYERIEKDLRGSWRSAGYSIPCLATDMKVLFSELERDVADRAAGAREGLLTELLGTGSADTSSA